MRGALSTAATQLAARGNTSAAEYLGFLQESMDGVDPRRGGTPSFPSGPEELYIASDGSLRVRCVGVLEDRVANRLIPGQGYRYSGMLFTGDIRDGHVMPTADENNLASLPLSQEETRASLQYILRGEGPPQGSRVASNMALDRAEVARRTEMQLRAEQGDVAAQQDLDMFTFESPEEERVFEAQSQIRQAESLREAVSFVRECSGNPSTECQAMRRCTAILAEAGDSGFCLENNRNAAYLLQDDLSASFRTVSPVSRMVAGILARKNVLEMSANELDGLVGLVGSYVSYLNQVDRIAKVPEGPGLRGPEAVRLYESASAGLEQAALQALRSVGDSAAVRARFQAYAAERCVGLSEELSGNGSEGVCMSSERILSNTALIDQGYDRLGVADCQTGSRSGIAELSDIMSSPDNLFGYDIDTEMQRQRLALINESVCASEDQRLAAPGPVCPDPRVEAQRACAIQHVNEDCGRDPLVASQMRCMLHGLVLVTTPEEVVAAVEDGSPSAGPEFMGRAIRDARVQRARGARDRRRTERALVFEPRPIKGRGTGQAVAAHQTPVVAKASSIVPTAIMQSGAPEPIQPAPAMGVRRQRTESVVTSAAPARRVDSIQEQVSQALAEAPASPQSMDDEILQSLRARYNSLKQQLAQAQGDVREQLGVPAPRREDEGRGASRGNHRAVASTGGFSGSGGSGDAYVPMPRSVADLTTAQVVGSMPVSAPQFTRAVQDAAEASVSGRDGGVPQLKLTLAGGESAAVEILRIPQGAQVNTAEEASVEQFLNNLPQGFDPSVLEGLVGSVVSLDGRLWRLSRTDNRYEVEPVGDNLVRAAMAEYRYDHFMQQLTQATASLENAGQR